MGGGDKIESRSLVENCTNEKRQRTEVHLHFILQTARWHSQPDNPCADDDATFKSRPRARFRFRECNAIYRRVCVYIYNRRQIDGFSTRGRVKTVLILGTVKVAGCIHTVSGTMHYTRASESREESYPSAFFLPLSRSVGALLFSSPFL